MTLGVKSESQNGLIIYVAFMYSSKECKQYEQFYHDIDYSIVFLRLHHIVII